MQEAALADPAALLDQLTLHGGAGAPTQDARTHHVELPCSAPDGPDHFFHYVREGLNLEMSELNACHTCGLSFGELSPSSFSFNNPLGMCPDCNGLGTKAEMDPERIVPDPSRSLREGAADLGVLWDLADLAGYGVGLERSTPLWFYILREAHLASGGQTLGPVGGRIVGEVLLGLLQSDRASWLHGQPGWRPTLPSRLGTGEFDMVDLLTLARVDPRSRGQ